MENYCINATNVIFISGAIYIALPKNVTSAFLQMLCLRYFKREEELIITINLFSAFAARTLPNQFPYSLPA